MCRGAGTCAGGLRPCVFVDNRREITPSTNLADTYAFAGNVMPQKVWDLSVSSTNSIP